MTRGSDLRVSDSKKLEMKILADKKVKEFGLLKKDFNETFATAAGRRVLRWLVEQSGYQVPNTVGDPRSGEILERATWYNEGRRNLYLQIRKFLKREILIDAEIRTEEDESGVSPK